MTLPDYQTLQIERNSKDVYTVRLNRPDERNAVNHTMHSEFLDMLYHFRDLHNVGAIVLTGVGKAFCAGGSMDFFKELINGGPNESARSLSQAVTLVRELLSLRPPIVAAVNGPAMGLGATLALACDIIFMADTAIIADTHVNVGVVAGDGGTLFWPLRLGAARAKEYLLTGDAVDGVTAERIGLVNYVVRDGEVETKALEMAERLAGGAREAIAYTKQAVNARLLEDAAQQMPLALALEVQTFNQPDVIEGRNAFLERRPPSWPSHIPDPSAAQSSTANVPVGDQHLSAGYILNRPVT